MHRPLTENRMGAISCSRKKSLPERPEILTHPHSTGGPSETEVAIHPGEFLADDVGRGDYIAEAGTFRLQPSGLRLIIPFPSEFTAVSESRSSLIMEVLHAFTAIHS
jgi:hypothetical protein